MNFLECIDIAVQAGKVHPEKADIAKQAYQIALDEAKLTGVSDRVAENQAAVAAVDHITKANSDKRWQKVNEIRVAAKVFKQFMESERPDVELIRLGDRLDVARERVANDAMSRYVENLEKYRPRFIGLKNSVEHMDEIVRAAYGDTSNPVAKQLYDEAANVMDYLRKRANMEGATIRENKNRRLPQQQDRTKLRQWRRKLGEAEARATWLKEHMDGLDWDLMEYDGKYVPPQFREQILNRTYDSILTEGNVRLVPGHRSSEALATRMGRERFLYYKDADTWLKMQEKYGAGNVFQQMTSAIEVMSRDISMLENLGPDPVSMKNYVSNVAKKRAADLDLLKENKTSMKAHVDKELSVFDDRFKIINHLVNNGAESGMAQIFGTTRTFVMAATLTKAFLSNLGDVGFAYNTGVANKIPMRGYLAKAVKNFVTMPKAQTRREALRAALGAESATSMALAMQRYLGPLDGSYAAKKMSDVVFRATWMTPLTQATRWAWGQHVMGVLHDFRKTAYEKLPFLESMQEFGVTKEDWDMFRQHTPVYKAENGSEYLRPVDLLNVKGLDTTVRQKTSDAIFDWILETGRRAAPTIDSRTSASLGNAVDANRASGQVLRIFGAVKSFPTVIMLLHMRDAMNAPSVGGKIWNIAKFTTMLTMMGALITQTKELAKGRDPRDMTDPMFWLESLLNGGSLGFAGDAIFGGLNQRKGGGLLSAFAGPVIEFMDKTRNLTLGNLLEVGENVVRGVKGERLKPTNAGKELVDWASRYVPIPWQLQLLLKRTLIDDMAVMADPRARQRFVENEMARRRNIGQSSWWPEGQKSPTRAPDFGAVFGGSKEDMR